MGKRSAAASKRIPVMIDADDYNRFKEYSEATGVPVSTAVREACQEWLNCVASVRLEALQEANSKIAYIDQKGNTHTLRDLSVKEVMGN